jgi:phage shock protein E
MFKPVIVIALILTAFFVGTTLSKPKDCGAACGNQIISVNAVEFAQASKDQAVTIIDVRTPEEYTQGHLEKAVNTDFNNQTQFQAYLNSLDKNAIYLIYCRTGNRSGQAMKLMEAKGFTNIINLDGGIQSWQNAGFTLEK